MRLVDGVRFLAASLLVAGAMACSNANQPDGGPRDLIGDRGDVGGDRADLADRAADMTSDAAADMRADAAGDVAGDVAGDRAGDMAGDMGGGTGNVRVAHLSPDAPAVDFCAAPHGTTTFIGPVLKMNGLASGLAFKQITGYLPLPVGQYDVRIVAPNAADCNTALAGLPDITNLPAVTSGAYVTVAALGQVTTGAMTPLQVKAYVDEHALPPGKEMDVLLRLVHAAPTLGPVDVYVNALNMDVKVTSNLAFPNFPTSLEATVMALGINVDMNGYIDVPSSLSGMLAQGGVATVKLRMAGSMTDLLTLMAPVMGGQIISGFAVGGDGMAPLQVLVCNDLAAAMNGLSACTALP